MTSRVSFYKVMIQDLRHRIWMIALSCLGSFLAMPVYYLLISQDWEDRATYWEGIHGSLELYKYNCIKDFFGNYLSITCGIILVVGALIVGIFGFRHVFSKKMVDQYHSIPVTRKTLFLAQYLNGFIIWFVPMFVGAIVCAILAAFFLGDFVAWAGTLGILMTTIINCVLAFLLVYHLSIVAVMLSGNILNTLVNGIILGFAVLALYCMGEAFCNTYFETYYSFFDVDVFRVFWTAPIVSAIYQLYMNAVKDIQVFPLVMNLIMVIVMWVAGFLLYIRRPSELAEQGMKIKPVQVVLKGISTILVGMAGWIFFDLLTGRLGWMIFGAVLAGTLCYGILDIIFHMDFKAFFRHKIQLCINVLLAIFIGLVFQFDWVGYDSYLPEKDNIASMGIYINNFGYDINSGSAYNGIMSERNRIESMNYTDKEVIYPLLEAMSQRENTYPSNGSSTYCYVKVTEESGKTYYRQYRIWEEDEELVLPILRDESYLKTNVLIPQVLIDDLDESLKEGYFNIENYFDSYLVEDAQCAKALLEAYNADILDNPDLYIYQEDEILVSVECNANNQGYFYMYMNLYQSMERVREVLKQYEIDFAFEEINLEEVESITLTAYPDIYNMESLAAYFGLEEEEEQTSSDIILNLDPDSADFSFEEKAEILAAVEIAENQKVTLEEIQGYYIAEITDKEDIAELLEVISLNRTRYGNIFRTGYCGADVGILYKNGDNSYVNLKNGKLPERFLSYFEKQNYE